MHDHLFCSVPERVSQDVDVPVDYGDHVYSFSISSCSGTQHLHHGPGHVELSVVPDEDRASIGLVLTVQDTAP